MMNDHDESPFGIQQAAQGWSDYIRESLCAGVINVSFGNHWRRQATQRHTEEPVGSEESPEGRRHEPDFVPEQGANRRMRISGSLYRHLEPVAPVFRTMEIVPMTA
jgi:hypothetical protein